MKKKSNTHIIGMRPVIETILAGHTISKIYLHHGKQEDANLRKELLTLIKARNIPYTKVPKVYLQRITKKNHQGVIAITSPIPFVELSHLLEHCYDKGQTPLFIILDQVQDIRNIGAIARSALGMGANALIIPTQGSALISTDAIKTSAGALHHIPVCRVNRLKDSIDYLKQSGLQILACDEKANQPIADANLTTPTALLFGGEAKGIAPAHRKLATDTFLIPMQGAIHSLNVSVAASIVLYEAARQRARKKIDNKVKKEVSTPLTSPSFPPHKASPPHPHTHACHT